MRPRGRSAAIVTAITLLVLLCARPHAARADVCGNGTLEPTEECEDGNLTPGDGCSQGCRIEQCSPTVLVDCIDAARALIQVKEQAPGKERLKLRWSKASEAITLAEFGAPGPPVGGVFSFCLYDDQGALAREVKIAKDGAVCGGTYPHCWRVSGASYVFQDGAGWDDAFHRAVLTAGPAGRGKAFALAVENGYERFPFGLAAVLSASVAPTMQLQTSAGLCLGATINEVVRAGGLVYDARKK